MNMTESKQRCPFCGGIISSTSTVCRHCGNRFQVEHHHQKQARKGPTSRKHLPVGGLFINILVGSIIILFLSAVAFFAMPASNAFAGSGSDTPTPTLQVSTPTASANAAVPPGPAGDKGAVAAAQPAVVGQGTNCIDGNIIDVYEAPQGGDGWIITIESSTAPGVILDQVPADLTGSFHLPSIGKNPLGAGTYIVSLIPPAGWQPFTPIKFTVTLNGSTEILCAHVRFKVEALVNLVVTKLDQGGYFGTDKMVGIPGWTITATPIDIPNAVTQTAVTDGLGNAYFLDMPPGIWQIEEEQKVGWELSPGYVNPQVITLVSPRVAGDTQLLTFVNQQVYDSKITVEKKDTLGNPLPGWTFTLTNVDAIQPPRTGITDITGLYTFQGLLPGKWSVAETTQPPWWRIVSPNPQEVTLSDPGIEQKVTFVNEALGCVDGYKINHLETALPGWTIKAHKVSGEDADQTVVTDINGYFQFYLSLGTWTISEVMQDGWSAVTPSEFSVPVTQPFLCENVRFKNRTNYACVDAYKIDAFDGSGLADWQISLQPAYGGSAQVGLTDGTGWVRFNKIIPGQYSLSEIFSETQTQGWRSVGVTVDGVEVPSPTNLTLAASGSCQVVKFYNQQKSIPVLLDP